jgi:cytochrome c biogenesis protein
VIIDPELDEPIEHTISVNHPLIYKGIAIYQSDFQDGGSILDFNLWDLFGSNNEAAAVKGTIFKQSKLGEGDAALTIEFNDFRKFNILDLSPDGRGKPRNVGANVTYKVRDVQGQAREYVSYMQPLQLDGRRYFVSGMRTMQQDEFRYLRIPVDDDFTMQGFMNLRAVMFDTKAHTEIASRFAAAALAGREKDAKVEQQLEQSVIQLLESFADGGYTRIATLIEESVPEAERETAAQTYIKIINGATFEAYNISLERAGKEPAVADESTQTFLQESLNAISDLFFYGTPFYLQMTEFEHREASGLQLTRSPGKNLVYFGSVLLVLGIFSMFYIRERRIWLLIKPGSATNSTEDSAESSGSVLFAMSSNRKNRDLDIEFERYREQLQRLLKS